MYRKLSANTYVKPDILSVNYVHTVIHTYILNIYIYIYILIIFYIKYLKIEIKEISL